jgi:tape measure domain-containing protein
MTPDQLRAELQSGKKLLEVAKKQGVTAGQLWLKMLEGLPFEKLAEILGLSADELQAELSSGKKLVDIAKEQGLTVEQFRAKLQEARKQFRAAGKQLGSLPSKKLPLGNASTQEKEQ